MNRSAAKLISKVILSDKHVKIKLLGDSITHGVGGSGFEQNGELIVEAFEQYGESYPRFARNPDGHCWAKLFKEHMESHYACTVINNACTGTRLEFIINNFDKLVDKDDDIIICTIGTNNRHQYFVDGPEPTRREMLERVYNYIVTLHGMFKKADKDVIFVANIPASAKNEESDLVNLKYWRVIHMNDINDLYMKASFECGFPFISMYSLFLEYCDMRNISVDSLLSDGLHPNDEGYNVMYKLIMKELGLGRPIRAAMEKNQY